MDVIVPDDQLSLAIGRKRAERATGGAAHRLEDRYQERVARCARSPEWLAEAVSVVEGWGEPEAEILLQRGHHLPRRSGANARSELLASASRRRRGRGGARSRNARPSWLAEEQRRREEEEAAAERRRGGASRRGGSCSGGGGDSGEAPAATDGEVVATDELSGSDRRFSDGGSTEPVQAEQSQLGRREELGGQVVRWQRSEPTKSPKSWASTAAELVEQGTRRSGVELKQPHGRPSKRTRRQPAARAAWRASSARAPSVVEAPGRGPEGRCRAIIRRRKRKAPEPESPSRRSAPEPVVRGGRATRSAEPDTGGGPGGRRGTRGRRPIPESEAPLVEIPAPEAPATRAHPVQVPIAGDSREAASRRRPPRGATPSRVQPDGGRRCRRRRAAPPQAPPGNKGQAAQAREGRSSTSASRSRSPGR